MNDSLDGIVVIILGLIFLIVGLVTQVFNVVLIGSVLTLLGYLLIKTESKDTRSELRKGDDALRELERTRVIK